jgi:stage V sporulation protein S
LEILKVSATSKPGAVTGAIAGVVRTQLKVEVHAIGPGAVNQAIKAIAISRGYDAGRSRSHLHPFVYQHLDRR